MVFSADVMRRQAGQLDDELEQARISGRSRDGAVTAVVSGHGRLLDLTISQSAMRGAHPQVVGADVVEAVATARRMASAVAVPKLRAVLDKNQEWQPAPGGAAVDDRTTPAARHDRPPSSSPRGRPGRADAEDESFENLDFLIDDGEPDEEGGRW
ncbi:YbaB/EbfC family nucleoid-associated protein [Amycolatopsis sp. cmx-4-61]|uniref:YbaB/EbfC family nucleoid-associated protein n=1 Tax=Amycolatopsis sp. cmx-4-61 TaxID=2790937 RepID=UPI00397B820B